MPEPQLSKNLSVEKAKQVSRMSINCNNGAL